MVRRLRLNWIYSVTQYNTISFGGGFGGSLLLFLTGHSCKSKKVLRCKFVSFLAVISLYQTLQIYDWYCSKIVSMEVECKAAGNERQAVGGRKHPPTKAIRNEVGGSGWWCVGVDSCRRLVRHAETWFEYEISCHWQKTTLIMNAKRNISLKMFSKLYFDWHTTRFKSFKKELWFKFNQLFYYKQDKNFIHFQPV